MKAPKFKEFISEKVQRSDIQVAVLTKLNADSKAIVNLSKPESSVSPGQACVFYSKDEHGTRLLGGGWIQSTN